MSKKLFKLVPPIPLDKIRAPWNETFRQLNELTRPCLLPLREPAIDLHLEMTDADWRIELYWVVKKKWNYKLKIPVSSKLAELHEPRGNLLYQLLQLCIGCSCFGFDKEDDLKQGYECAAEWFLNLILEAKKKDYEIIILQEAKGKHSIIEEKREIMAQFRDLKNPANPKTFPEYHRLIKVALSKEKNDEFNEKYWKPFLKACCQDIQSIEKKTCQETFVVDNKIFYRRPGQSRGIHLLIDCNYQQYQKLILEPLPCKAFSLWSENHNIY
jgi:hypothetical protein